MNKKLLAVAVAGALAAPGVALAQASSVTISGYFKMGLENLSVSNAASGRLNTSQMRIVDGSSQIIFKAIEDLGNGLSAVGQLDVRFDPAQASNTLTKVGTSGDAIGAGNTYVGLMSKTMGTVTMGRWDLHYGKVGHGDIVGKAGALQASAVSLFDNIGSIAIANNTRTQNVVKYDSPNWGGFAATVAWSANPVGNSELDMVNATALNTGVSSITPGAIPGTATVTTLVPNTLASSTVPGGTNTRRKGDGWNINPTYVNGPLDIGYSYWKARPDAPVYNTNDQRGDSAWVGYKFGGFKAALGWNKSTLTNSDTGATTHQRTAWSVPLTYTWGPNNIVGHYTKAGNDNGVSNTGAKMYAVAYVYDLSKRTSLGLTYAKINNDSGGVYNFFTTSSLGSTDAGAAAAGEKPRMIQATIKHAF